MDDIEIPESNDPEWQIMMLRELDAKFGILKENLDTCVDQGFEDVIQNAYWECQKIISALREYSGY
ncbi:hypothetical protein AB7185_21205 [Providencia rettgeri]|uniref:Uncharacterized protein n=1 Tax=Providencia rettgeri TaxID=587 RepID=A0A9N8D3S5_PRORE|nr:MULTISPECIES: hypothetical protein [Providencia]THB29043.1 hypothetical protein E6R27_03060 [Providencia sp. MGF014]CAB5645041.1 Uncharacterised protein [Providencia rettgeri]CAB5709562.1 Uncharacterised protein [Providencia rettgeri]CAC9186212.1 Uncharacterised protein [Providencia rettgeri]CAC9226986.1 Uncharacterised protein [Providencia rettgeri]